MIKKDVYSTATDKRNTIVALFLIVIISSFWRYIVNDEPIYNRLQTPRMGFVRVVHSAMITEDLYLNGLNPFKTKVFYKGDKGIYVQEFPLYNMILAGLYKIYKVDYQLGVYLSIISYGLALIIFFFFLRKYIEEHLALGAVFILAVAPHALLYGGMYMPFSLDVLLMVANLYFFLLYLEKQTVSRFAVSSVILLLHLLQKGIFLVMGFVMLLMAYQRFGKETFKRKDLWALALPPLIIMGAWYTYGIITSVQIRPGLGNGYFLPLKEIFKLSFQLIVWWSLIKSLTLLFSLIGVVFILIGAATDRSIKLYRVLIVWIASFIFFGIFFPRVWKAHEYYHIFIAFPLSVLLVKGIEFTLRLLSIPILKKFVSFVLIAFYVLNCWLMSVSTFRQYSIDFIGLLGKRINNLTSENSRLLVLDINTGLWRWEWLFASKRIGYQLRPSPSIVKIKKVITALQGDHFAYIRLPKDYYRDPWNLQVTLRDRLFGNYRLADSFLDEYMLFDTERTNIERINEKGFITLNIDFTNGLMLVGILIESPDINGKGADLKNSNPSDVTFFWKIEKKTFGNLYMVVLSPDEDYKSFNHKIMSNSFPLADWKVKPVYAERIRYEWQKMDNIEKIKALEYFIYDRRNGQLYHQIGFKTNKERYDEALNEALSVVQRENHRFKELQKDLHVIKYSTSSPRW